MGDAVKVRRATSSDSDAVLSLFQQFNVYLKLPPLSAERKERFLDAAFQRGRYVIWLAEYDGRPVGYVVTEHVIRYPGFPVLMLQDLFVAEDMREKGVGNALFMKCVEEAAQSHSERIEWETNEWQREAVKFYEDRGAVRSGGVIHYHLPRSQIERLARGLK